MEGYLDYFFVFLGGFAFGFFVAWLCLFLEGKIEKKIDKHRSAV